MREYRLYKVITILMAFVLFMGSVSLYAFGNQETRMTSNLGKASYVLSFDLNGGESSLIADQTVAENANASVVNDPTLKDYTFVGWNTSIDGSGDVWDFNTSTMPGNDLTLYAQWEAILYDAVFNINGGDPFVVPTQSLAVGEPIFEPTEIPTKIGSEFLGWSLAPSDRTTVTFEHPMESGGVQFYAQYNTLLYDLIYDQNGGTGGQAPRRITYNSTITKQSSIPTRTGYTFDTLRYCVDPSCTETKLYGFEKMPPNNLTIYSKWTINSHEMSFDLNGAPGTNPDTQTVDFEQLATDPGTVVNPGYTFTGWNTSPDGTGTAWDFDTDTMPDNDVKLYAQWTINSYVLSFDLNGAPGTNPESQTVEYNALGTSPETVSYTGYTFIEWNTTADGTGSAWDFATNKMPANDVTLYAKWEKNPYQLSFDLNGAPGTNPADQTVLFEELGTDPGEVLNPGYTFNGWNTSPDGTGSAWDFATSTMPANDVTLYAQWSINSYVLSFDLNGAPGVAPASQTVEYNALGTSPETVSYTGYTFVEWNTTADGTGTVWDFATNKMPANDVTLYAKWAKNPYQLNFELNGAPGTNPVSQTVEFEALGTNPETVSYTGYTFIEWNTMADGTGSAWDFATNKMPANDVTLYAKWEKNPYQLSFDLNGAPGTNPADQTVLFEDLATDPGAVSNPGYTFNGWNTSPDGTGTTWDFTTSTMPANDVILYAQWTVNSYVLSFDLNGAPGVAPASQTLDFDTLGTEAETVTYAGHEFISWNTLADGTGVVWDFATNRMPANDVTLFAQWKKIPYNATFDLNGTPGTTPDSQTVLPGDPLLKPADPNAPDKIFVGWSTDPTGNGPIWDYTTDVMPDEDIVLYAIWEDVEYIVSYDLNGSTSTKPSDESVIAGDLVTDPNSVPVLDGFTFGGWSTAPDGSGSTWDFNLNEMPSNDMVLYAIWLENPYEVTFDLNGFPGTQPSDQLVEVDGLITEPVMPEVPGYEFNGWDVETPDGLVKWDFDTMGMPPKDVVLIADWNEVTFNVSFETNGAISATPDSQDLFVDDKIGRPVDPVKPGYEFTGWTTADGVLWDFDTMGMPAQDIVLTATYNELNINIKFDPNGGPFTVPSDIITKIGSLIANPSIETINNFKFNGWSLSPDGSTGLVDFSSMKFMSDATLYAQYSEVTPPASVPVDNTPAVVEKEAEPLVVEPSVAPVQEVQKEKLVETGENNLEMMLFGMILMVLSFVGIVKRKF